LRHGPVAVASVSRLGKIPHAKRWALQRLCAAPEGAGRVATLVALLGLRKTGLGPAVCPIFGEYTNFGAEIPGSRGRG
jgi:hypothetical protein